MAHFFDSPLTGIVEQGYTKQGMTEAYVKRMPTSKTMEKQEFLGIRICYLEDHPILVSGE